MAMLKLIRLALMLPLLLLLLPGCAPKQAALLPGSLPVMPELPPSARQGPTPQECLPKCLQAWKQKAERWQKLLSEQGLPVEPVSEPMTGSGQ
jgi:hypothetical protein